MSYDDDTMHLVFKYNEEYENDLEIHKSATIQGLVTRKAIMAASEGVQQKLTVEMSKIGLGEMIASAPDKNRVNTDDDRSAFQNGNTANNLLMQHPVALGSGEKRKNFAEPDDQIMI